MARPKTVRKTMILNDDLEFEWEITVIDKVINLWNEGKHIEEITQAVTPKAKDYENIFWMLRGLRHKNLIKDREGGIWGNGCKS